MARDYKHEYESYHGKPEQIKKRAQRNAARADAEKRLGKPAVAGKDVDHKTPIRKGGGNAGNTRVVTPSKNRAWREGKKGYD